MAWQEKEFIALGAAIISSVSLTVSYITYKQKNKETERIIKSQLTESIMKLDGVFAEWDKLIYEQKGKPPDPYYVGRRSFLNGQKRFLAKQALYLMESAPRLVSDFEYNRVADALSSIGDFEKSNPLYLQAIEAAKEENYKAVCLRAYARSLFNQAKFDEGREYFQQAVDALSKDTNVNLYSKAETYQRWASMEAENDFYDNAKSKIENAKAFYSKITTSRNRRQGLQHLSELEKMIFPNDERSPAANIVLPKAGLENGNLD